MNYTKNYHLPQWVKSDRIRMEDFNSAMASIDSGLAGLSSSLDSSSASCGQVWTQAWDALLRSGRLALSDRLDRFDRNSLHASSGTLFNPLSSAEMAESLNGAVWDAELGVHAGRGGLLPDNVLLECCTACQTGYTWLTPVMPADSFYEFTAPVNGAVLGFNMDLYSYFNPSSPPTVLDLTLTVEKLTGSGAGTLLTKPVHVERSGTKVTEEEIPIEVKFAIKKGDSYRLTLTQDVLVTAQGQYGFLTSPLNTDIPGGVPYTRFRVVESSAAAVTHTRSFPTGGAASHALAVVRCRREEAGSTVRAVLDGKTMSKIGEETVTGADGAPCLEIWFSAEGSYQGSAQIKLTLDSSPTDDLRLLEYAVMLL